MFTFVSQYGPEFPPERDLHQHVNIFPVPEGPVEPGDEHVPAGHHDVPLAVDVLLLVGLHDVLLLHALESEGLQRIFLALDQLHSPEAAHAERCQDVEVVQVNVLELLGGFGDEVTRTFPFRLHHVIVNLPSQLLQVANKL